MGGNGAQGRAVSRPLNQQHKGYRDDWESQGFRGPQNQSVPLGDVVARLTGHIETLARELTGADPTSRSGAAIRFRGKGSLAVWIAGSRRGRWYDHEAVQGGDALGLVAHLRGVPMREAYRWALGWLGVSAERDRPAPKPSVAPSLPPQDAPRTQGLWQTMWREAQSARGTLVEAYLASRGLTLPAGAPLRFHPACHRGADRLPAMVALMTDPDTGEPRGVHRTFLRADGGGKAEGEPKKAMLGHAGVIRLVPDDEVTIGLGIAEGIETALAVMQRTGWRPVWAAGSAGAIARLPVLSGIETLTIFADTGAAGIGAAEQCAGRWAAAGREARIIAPPAGDWDGGRRGAGCDPRVRGSVYHG